MFTGLWRVIARVRAFFGRDALDRDFAQELESHVAMLADDGVRRGMTHEEARRMALIRVGARASLQDQHRDVRGLPGLETILQDLRYAARMQARAPGMTAAIVLTLALGVGINASIFSIINALVMKPILANEPHRLVRVYTGSNEAAYPNYLDMRVQATMLESLAAYDAQTVSLGRPDAAELVRTEAVSDNYFEVLGVNAFLGRTLSANPTAQEGGPVAVISYDLWRRGLGAEQTAVGRTLIINGRPLVVIGVMPRGFRGAGNWTATDIWLDASFLDPVALQDRTRLSFELIGRLRPGVSIDAAQPEISTIGARLALPESRLDPVTGLTNFRGVSYAGRIYLFFALLSVVGLLILMVACVTIVNLLLTRAAVRSREFAIRRALGAGTGRLARQLMAETVVWSMLGGLATLLFALWTSAAAASQIGALPIHLSLNTVPDFRVLTFAFVLSMAVGAIATLTPTLRLSRINLSQRLRRDSRSTDRVWLRFKGREMLVAFQLAASVVLLVVSGLFLESLQNAQKVDPGFDAAKLVNVSFTAGPGASSEPRIRARHGEILQALASAPAVDSATLAAIVPLTMDRITAPVRPDVEPVNRLIDRNHVGPAYFSTMGIALVRGREFTLADTNSAPPVAIVNQAFARESWGGLAALGRTVTVAGEEAPREIIGIVEDSKYVTLGEESRPFLYLPMLQVQPRGRSGVIAHLRTSNPVITAANVRPIAQRIDSQTRVTVETMTDALAVGFFPVSASASLFSALGGLSLILAIVGLYSVASYSVTQRAREIGIRLALGEAPSAVQRQVIARGTALVTSGLVVGALLAAGLARAVSSLLVGLHGMSITTYVAVCVILTVAGVLATWAPARRAARVDPLTALRCE